jgi:predicted metal-dependent HD superfamily phosphohydrolase
MIDNQFFLDVEEYVFNLYKNELSSKVVYHNFIHTKSVVDAVIEISEAEKVSKEDVDILKLGAWFHDIGFVLGSDNHEEKSKKIAEKYLVEKGLDKAVINKVKGLIEATKMPQKPTNFLEEILCDADLHHLGTKSFFDKSDLLRAEWELLCDKYYTDIEWLKIDDHFLAHHKFFTNYAFKKFHKQKTANWLKIKNDLRKLNIKKEEQENKLNAKKEELDLKVAAKKEDIRRKKEKEKISERGIETMYRVAFRNHIKLSAIADAKAHILLSVSAIVISIVISKIFPKLDKEDNYFLFIPTILFLIVAVATMIYSIISTLPKITSGTFTKEDVTNKKVNLLFFGNFYKMPLPDFQEGMREVMKDKDYLYSSLMKDLYFLGVVLSRKYKLLRIAYTIFMIGTVVTVFLYIISVVIMKDGGLTSFFNSL